VLDRDPSVPLPKGGGTSLPQFLAHVYSAQTVGWIKMKLCMEVGLGSGHIVLKLDKDHNKKKQKMGKVPIFGPRLLWQTAAHLSNC